MGTPLLPLALVFTSAQSVTSTLHHHLTPLNFTSTQHVWPWKGRKGSRQGRRQASPQDPSRQHPRHHQACHPPSRSPWWCQAYLGPHLRGDARCPQDLPREHHPRLGHLHGARQAQDGHVARRRLRPQARRQDPLRFRPVIICRREEEEEEFVFPHCCFFTLLPAHQRWALHTL